MQRRTFLQLGLASSLNMGLAQMLPAKTLSQMPKNRPHVVVVGGGFGGATVAKYIRVWSQGWINVSLIEPSPTFVSCPMSNKVVAGFKSLQDITHPYTTLTQTHGVRHLQAQAQNINFDKREVSISASQHQNKSSHHTLTYDKLVLSPGIDLMHHSIEGLTQANTQQRCLQAWKAGLETQQLQKQLHNMPNGGTYLISIPLAPYRCPPGPYERASVVAAYFKAHKPRSKVIVLDANPDIVSKSKLFKSAWQEHYPNLLEYHPNQNVIRVDAATRMVYTEFDNPIKADVLNLLPPMRAGSIAINSGIATLNERWAEVNYLDFESTLAPHVHVIGDSVQGAPLMPKSGHIANSQAKVVAASITAKLLGWEPNPAPLINNTCYSYTTEHECIHVASVHQYLANEKTYKVVEGSGGVSTNPSILEGEYAWGWAQNIWTDILN